MANEIIKSYLVDSNPKISALLITYNEAKHIEDVINNIAFADEIIVVDSNSTDGTLSILEKYENVTVIVRPFKNFTDQRNFAISKAKHEWILFIDADERIPPNLKKEILETVKTPNGFVGFMVKRLYFFKKKRIRFSGFQSDTTYRLFKKNTVNYIEDKLVHEIPEIIGKTKLLKHPMLHYCFDSNQHYKSKMEHYARLKAQELHIKGKKANISHFILRPFYKFIVNYFFRLGILDGIEGFNICYLSAYGVYYRYKILKELNT